MASKSSVRSLRHALNGVFSVYKPTGYTSRDAVNMVQDSLSEQLRLRMDFTKKLKNRDKIKIGHGGTLDPLAEGVLILGVGDGCKKLHDFLHCTKEYLVLAKFGQATDSYDSEGTITHSGSTSHISRQSLLSILPQFKGEITQVPPIYSAISIQGKRAYDYARQGIALPRPIEPRQVQILALDLVEFHHPYAVYRVECGGGTYMRSLVHDIGLALGSYSHMTGLKRTRQGTMTIQDALELTMVDDNSNDSDASSSSSINSTSNSSGTKMKHIDLDKVIKLLH
ncbi:putative tRNA pseudouridine synthase 1-like protein [Zychaea mexicana]|uniref:putative tRNA pseudouridine synthase 1-like protein n=1 Tax=Zychaea mexicana TaxID=64656 RepID=UPI0022FDE3AB|nr:putative tRNA pseudouridine synthase 1-like protein [Zychaea mexicana]KAI9497465.1 putative tRNA pseudouridine synthase 1-like protein [Zychaea mexicana]